MVKYVKITANSRNWDNTVFCKETLFAFVNVKQASSLTAMISLRI